MKIDTVSIVISAPSGTGKTTLIYKLLDRLDDLSFVTSTTTRDKRLTEEEGKNYYYVSNNKFQKMIDDKEFLEWAIVHGNRYGTTKKEVDRIRHAGRIPVFDVDVQGARILKSIMGGATFIFIIPPTFEALKKRLKNRATDSEQQIATRLDNAITELKEYTMYDYIVVNDKIDSALSDLESIIRAQMLSKNFMEEKVRLILENNNDHPSG